MALRAIQHPGRLDTVPADRRCRGGCYHDQHDQRNGRLGQNRRRPGQNQTAARHNTGTDTVLRTRTTAGPPPRRDPRRGAEGRTTEIDRDRRGFIFGEAT